MSVRGASDAGAHGVAEARLGDAGEVVAGEHVLWLAAVCIASSITSKALLPAGSLLLSPLCSSE